MLMSMTKPAALAPAVGWFRLAHPGPAAACTALTLLAGRPRRTGPAQAGGIRRNHLTRAALAMFLAQISTGSLNDVFDREHDSVHQPYKPIPRGEVSPPGAFAFALASGLGCLWLARSCGSRVARMMVLGLAAGWSYDLGLSRTPFSFVPFSAGIMTVPWIGALAGEEEVISPRWMTAISGLLGLGLHLANGGPDAVKDRLAGRRSLPVLLGEKKSRQGTHLALTVGALLSVFSASRRGRPAASLGAAGCIALLAVDRHQGRLSRTPGHHPFVLPVLAAGVLAAGWLTGARESR